ncbi:MAG: hypothetical protein V7651_05355 [Hyphomonas oceanitis]|uniref:hypothetical protein n=1 Tax=Hyphomonas oceanitis TaxID=81033 RepID=UPI0030039CCE
MKYIQNRKTYHVPEQELIILADHSPKPAGTRHISNVVVETSQTGRNSLAVINREMYGSGSIVFHLSDILVARGSETMTIWLKNGDRLEDLPISQLTLKALVREFGAEAFA